MAEGRKTRKKQETDLRVMYLVGMFIKMNVEERYIMMCFLKLDIFWQIMKIDINNSVCAL